jgi:ATP-binding cassette subfamily B protein
VTPDPLENAYHADKPWRTLLALYRPERRRAILALLAYLVKASPLWVLPVVTANIIDIVSLRSSGGMTSLWINTAVATVMLIQNVPMSVLYVDTLSRAIRNVENRLRSALVRRLQMLSIGYHTRASTAALQTKVLRDVESVEQLSRQLVDVGLTATIGILVALVVTAWRMPVFLPVFVVIMLLAALIRRSMAGRLRRYSESLRREIEAMSAHVLGMINMIPITRAHAVEEVEIARVENQFGQVRKAAWSFDHQTGLFAAAVWATFMLFNVTCLSVGAWLSLSGRIPLTPGDIVLMTGYCNTIVGAVVQLNSMLPLISRGFDALGSIGEVLECPDIEENRGKRHVKEVRGAFRFEQVCFHYDTDDDVPRPALRDITLDIAPGETVGIAGESGSGKSTLASLVTGFHRPTSGRILLDGTDMNGIDLRTFRRHLAVVSQSTILFTGTLRENITYGIAGVKEAALWKAVAAANAVDFISELPHGLDTGLGGHGTHLSGGQRQRIAIARALLRDPRVLILDEATSALDSGSEAVVQEALERLMAGRTTFIIAHRLAALRRASRVILLDKGAVVETGTPTELAAQAESRYARLLRIQTGAAAA